MKCCDLPTTLVLGMLGALAAASIGWRALDAAERGRVETARRKVSQICELVGHYRKETHRLPDEGSRGVKQLLMHFEPLRYREYYSRWKDPWQNDYRIERRDLGAGAKPLCIVSYGADGREGGSGYAEDIVQSCRPEVAEPASEK